MAEDISDPFFSAVAKEMEEIAYKNGYKIIYCSTENNKDRAAELISLFQNRQVDAFIITPPENFEKEIQELITQKNEVIMLFDRRYTSTEHNYVILDNFNGAKMAVNKLISSGCKNIAYVGLKSDFSCMSERLEGYKDAIKDHQSQPISLLLPFKDVKTKAGRIQFEKFINKHTAIDGILFATNGLAINGLKGLKELHKNIPDELAALKEIYRVLLPGGKLYFDEVFGISGVSSIFKNLMEQFGASKLLSSYEGFRRGDYGNKKKLPYNDQISLLKILSDIGFSDINIRSYTSPKLMNLACFFQDIDMVFGMRCFSRLNGYETELYANFINDTLIPLIEEDRELCCTSNNGIHYFVSAKK